MQEKEIMTVKQVAEYLQMDEHTIYKSQPIQRMGWTQPFYKKGCGFPALEKSPQSKSLVSGDLKKK